MSFNENVSMVRRLKKACALNDDTMGKTKQKGISKENQMQLSLHFTEKMADTKF
jgi:hypothetical protein